MCGRFGFDIPKAKVIEHFQLTEPCEDELRFGLNIAPMSLATVIIGDGARRAARLMRWGLVPSWSKDPAIGAKMFNVRSETAPEKPSFRAPFKRRRCLVPAHVFYEWKKAGAGSKQGKPAKQPYGFSLAGPKDENPALFAMAGLWDVWSAPEGGELLSFTILTCEPNELAAAIHNRMPVILAPENYAAWFDPDASRADLLSLCAPFPSQAMRADPVDPLVFRKKPGPDDAGPGPDSGPEQLSLF